MQRAGRQVDASVSHLCESAPDESVKESLGGGFKGPVADDKMLGPLRKHPFPSVV